MKENNRNELIERYLYEVVRHLPEKQKADIEQELRTLIEDMILEREDEGKSHQEVVESVLETLGEPAKLARNYRGEKSSLISGEYYDHYCYILKIVLICAGVGILIANVVSTIIHVVDDNMGSSIWSGFLNVASIPSILIQIFGWITLIFFLMERNQVKVNLNETKWSLAKLPQIPYKKAVIGRGESAFGIIMGSILLIVFIFAPQLLGAWIKQGDEMISIPLFNQLYGIKYFRYLFAAFA